MMFGPHEQIKLAHFTYKEIKNVRHIRTKMIMISKTLVFALII